MAIEVTVGPPLVTINQGNTFVVCEPRGCIAADAEQGTYSQHTRYVSNYDIFADGERWILQNSGAVTYYAFRAYLTNARILTEYGEIEPATLSLVFNRTVSDSIHEDFDLHNYGVKRARFNLEVSVRTDFADIFEVKTKRVIRKGNVTTHWSEERSALTNTYEHDTFKRSLLFRLAASGSPASYSNGRVRFFVDLDPGGSW